MIKNIKNIDNKLKTIRFPNQNRGMTLENEIDTTNIFYKENDIALIYKKPTPIKIVKMSKDNKKIVEAFFEKKSTTDYNGIYKGKHIDFEAKETISTTSFPLKNIKSYQLEHLKKIKNHGGIAFIIFLFIKLNKYYILFIDEIDKFMDENNRESIPIDYFKKINHTIERKINPPIDYLSILEDLI